MKLSRFIILSLLLSTASLSLTTYAANENVNPNATVVKLRTSCIEGGTSPVLLNDCFEAIETISGNPLSGLQAWINGRSATTPLVVEIGPGTFTAFVCAKSDISLIGSGPEMTTLGGPYSANGIVGGSTCINLNVKDLTIIGSFIPILWNNDGGGSSRWTNVNVGTSGAGYLWFEACGVDSNAGNRAIHYWFNSRLTSLSTAVAAYNVHCSENWFFSSEIVSQGGPGIMAATRSDSDAAKPEIHVYGSVIRVNALPDQTKPSPAGVSGVSPTYDPSVSGFVAVASGRGGNVHVHGTSVEVIGNTVANDIAALMAWDGGEIHANESSYDLSTASGGQIQRINNSASSPGHVHGPYLWEPQKTPPVNAGSTANDPGNVLVSIDGADFAVETDCSSILPPNLNPGCKTVGTEPHILIYKKSIPCTAAEPWWDQTTKACR